MHIVLASVTVLLMLLAVGYGATAFGKTFRLYSVASIVILVGFGGLTFVDAPRLAANLPTPWLGVWERINVAVFLLWVVVLAAVLLRIRNTAANAGRRTIHGADHSGAWYPAWRLRQLDGVGVRGHHVGRTNDRIFARVADVCRAS